VRAFKGRRGRMFLISLKAGGFGLNLTKADYCFLLDPWCFMVIFRTADFELDIAPVTG
jgi:hypothetical protein